MNNRMIDLVSTYRIQFHSGFTFAHLEQVLPYLHQLGVKTMYASPIFKSVPGSNHGYNVTDPLQVNPELGTLEQLRAISTRMKSLGMNWLQDIVPNHMAYHPCNHWLMDVLEKGPSSRYASYFDVTLRNTEKLMAPFLSDTLEQVVERKEVQLVYTEKGLAFRCGDLLFPVQLESYLALLQGANGALDALKDEISNNDVDGLKLGLCVLLRDPVLQAYLDTQLERTNNSPQALIQLAAQQHYELCHWRETEKRINYRRFFIINEMICLNMQHEEVFDHYHQLVKQLVDEDVFQGVRVDHIDGLSDPSQYLERLRALVGEQVYIAVEKILEPGERLPAYWPVQGTTGYDFLATVNNAFTNRKGKDAFADFYDEEICKDKSIKYEIFSKKALILNKYMVGELDNLYHLFCDLELAKNSELVAVSERGIKQAIGALLIHCPVYRYYCTHFPLDKEEAGAISDILKSIGGDDGDRAIVILRQVLLKCPQDGDPAYNARVAKFYMRCMQFSGPLMAKGVEDTVMYTYNRFIAHNEVGDAPSSFGITVDEYHRFMQKRLASWPRAMNATATHDMKRGEDARMRLNVLSDIPALWVQKVKEWQELNKNKKQQGAPDANEEYFIYEALVAAYPMPGQPFDDFTNRFRAYIRKASREAKRHTNWNVANDEYEMSMEHFIDGLLHEDSPFLKSFEDYLHSIADHGILNSLCQQVLKYTSPGVPDTYQGCELWDLSMVDPDNRRPVDYQLTSRLLSNIDLRKTDAHLFVDLWESRYSGKIKLWLVQKMLQLRAEEHMVFATGAYTPLDVKGKYKNDIIAYARQTERVVVVVVLPLHTAAICAEQGCELNNVDWRDTVVTLPEDSSVECVDLITGIRKKTSKIVNVNDLFDMSHFAVLKYDAADNPRGAGILLPMFSVPSPFGIGDFGKGTKEFADFLYRSGQKYWQLLPLNPTEMGTFHSPYSSISSMAGNPLLISPELLAEEGLLDRKELKEYHLPDKSFIDYKKVEKTKYAILDIAWQRFKDGEYRKLEVAFEKYCVEQNAWLDDFALYRVVKDQNNGLPWYEWQDKYKWRDAQTLSTFARERADDIKRVKWLQFIVANQWGKVRDHCRDLGIKLVGDMPFYVSYDSVDIWASPELFNLDSEGKAIGVAGVPPDYFSEDGQLWGMPTFKWDKMREDNYAWWMLRLRKNLDLFDLVRLDHFRAFETYWEVPAGETTARNGKWIPGPRMHFFEVAARELGGLPLIAEDLGYEMEDVYRLRDTTGLPGMKVLQFAWGDNLPVSVDAPHNYSENCVVYTGTHDNNTTIGWYKHETKKVDHKRMREYLGTDVDADNVHTVMARVAYASVANIAILPIQDILGLDEKYRMNTPGTTKDNWMWRLPEDALNGEIEKHLHDWVMLFKRK